MPFENACSYHGEPKLSLRYWRLEKVGWHESYHFPALIRSVVEGVTPKFSLPQIEST